MSIRVAVSELDIRTQVKRAGGAWQRDRRVWALQYDQVVALGLEGRIVTEVGYIDVYTLASRKKGLMHLPVYTGGLYMYIPVDTVWRSISVVMCN